MIRFKQFLNEGVHDPGIFKAIFLSGGPGSGKSFVSKKTTSGMGLKVVNSDEIFTYLLKKSNLGTDILNMTPKEYEKAMEIRAGAKSLLSKKQELFLKGRLGMVIDGTGKNFNKIKDQSEELKKMGYDTFLIFVNTSLEVALERNKNRERKVPVEIVMQGWKSVQGNIGKFQQYFGQNNMIIVDNNDAKEDVLTVVFKKVSKFVKRPIHNNLAKQWIDAELSKLKK